MIIFGTRGVTYTADKGSFYCPECHTSQDYARKRVRRFFTLYFIPVFPMDRLGEYIECRSCRNTFRESVLNYSPEASAAKFETEFHTSVKRVMTLMMLADGEIADSEIQAIQDIYQRVSGSQISESDVKKEINVVKKKDMTVTDYLKEVAPYLNEHGKELILKSAIFIAAADGVFDERENRLLGEIAHALQMSPSHFKGILAEFASQGQIHTR
jgi:tellurite resistance protein